jgi:hypothetical protein
VFRARSNSVRTDGKVYFSVIQSFVFRRKFKFSKERKLGSGPSGCEKVDLCERTTSAFNKFRLQIPLMKKVLSKFARDSARKEKIMPQQVKTKDSQTSSPSPNVAEAVDTPPERAPGSIIDTRLQDGNLLASSRTDK